MKRLVLHTGILMMTLIIFSACKKSSTTPPSVQETQLSKLTKSWTLTSITLDGVNKKDASNYNNFKLTFSGTYNDANPDASYSYSVSGRPALSAWPASGDFKFGSSPETQLVRDPNSADELNMTYSVAGTPAVLTISFNYSGTGYSRTSEVNGNWVMTFN